RMPVHLAIPAVTTFGYAGVLAGPALIGFLAQGATLAVSLLTVAGVLAAAGLLGARIAVRHLRAGLAPRSARLSSGGPRSATHSGHRPPRPALRAAEQAKVDGGPGQDPDRSTPRHPRRMVGDPRPHRRRLLPQARRRQRLRQRLRPPCPPRRTDRAAGRGGAAATARRRLSAPQQPARGSKPRPWRSRKAGHVVRWPQPNAPLASCAAGMRLRPPHHNVRPCAGNSIDRKSVV